MDKFMMQIVESYKPGFFDLFHYPDGNREKLLTAVSKEVALKRMTELMPDSD